jgi:hypothetical protein
LVKLFLTLGAIPLKSYAQQLAVSRHRSRRGDLNGGHLEFLPVPHGG